MLRKKSPNRLKTADRQRFSAGVRGPLRAAFGLFPTSAIVGIAAFAALFVLLPAGPASADEPVAFSSADPNHTMVGGFLSKPKGAGPFPAVVLIHTCLGLPANRAAIQASVVAWGYVA